MRNVRVAAPPKRKVANKVQANEIWEEFSIQLRHFVEKRIRNDDVEDVLQEVFLKIHSKIGSIKDDNKIYAWIYQITRNAIVDYYRKKNKSAEIRELTEDITSEPDDNLSEQKEIGSCLRAMIDKLPEKYKQAIVLTEFQNLTHRELSEKLGLSLSGAKSRVQRSRAMLKEMLLGCCYLEFDRLGNIIDHTRKTKD